MGSPQGNLCVCRLYQLWKLIMITIVEKHGGKAASQRMKCVSMQQGILSLQ